MLSRLSRLLLPIGALGLALALSSCAPSSEGYIKAPTDDPTTPPVESTAQTQPESNDPGIPMAPVTDDPEVGEDLPAKAAEEERPDITTGAPVPAVQPSLEVDDDFVEDTLNAIHAALEKPEVQRDMTQVLSGQALDDFENQRAELVTTGLRMEGEMAVTQSRQIDSPTPDTIVNEVCVDNSGLRTLDENNNDVTSPNAQGRSRMLLTFTDAGKTWTLSELSFPDDPNC